MKIISLITQILRYLPSEFSHHVALKGLKLMHFLGILSFFGSTKREKNKIKHRDIRKLSNSVGIAAGLDKNGDYIDCLSALGIGFVEVGTVTPKPQKGNPKPRIFRDRKTRSLINRLGFNNKGVDYLVEKLKSRKSDVIVGSSIGKNYNTPNENAHLDYVYCLNKVYEFSDYIAVNISSPNTENLRDLSNTEYLNKLLQSLKSCQLKLSSKYGYKPIFIKLSPDESQTDLELICECILHNKLDGIISGNTSINHNSRFGLGGLSGAPLKQRATENLILIREIVGNSLPIIASGGVMSVQDYFEKVDSGADLVQLYTGLIYEGPQLVKNILNHLSN